MPLRPAHRLTALLAGALLTGAAAWPILAQAEAPEPTSDTVPEVELRPSLPLDPASEAAAQTPVDDPATPADESAGPADDNAADLEEVEATLSLSRERIDALKAEIAAMEGDRTQQNAALIAAAQRVKLAEIEVERAKGLTSGRDAAEVFRETPLFQHIRPLGKRQ